MVALVEYCYRGFYNSSGYSSITIKIFIKRFHRIVYFMGRVGVEY